MVTIASESGGALSAYMLKLICEHGVYRIAVFADVKGTGYSHFWSDLPSIEYLLHERFGGESADTYRLLWQLSSALNTPITRLEDGRSIWSVFGQTRSFRLFIGNQFLCKASEILKREVIAKHVLENYTPGAARMALGMSVLEPHRIKNAQHWWSKRLGYDIEVYSPLIDHYQATGVEIDNCVIFDWFTEIGLMIPSAYERGLKHNNCGGVCSQAGQGQYAELYAHDYQRYMYAAWQEYRLRTILGIDATILKDERGGTTRKMSLLEFENRIQIGDVNHRDTGGACSCVVYANVSHQLKLM